MNAFISDRATRRLPLLLVSALAGLLAAALLIAGIRPTQAAGATGISMVVSPPTLTANGFSTAFITATVYSGTERMPGVPVTFSLSSPTLGSILPLTTTTDFSGTALSKWTAGTAAGNGQLNVTDGGFTQPFNITLTAGLLMTITVSPGPVTVTVGTTRTFSAAGVDRYENSVPVTPTWKTNANGGTINSRGVFTAPTGVATGRLVTATYGGVTGTATVNIAAGPVNTITVQVNPATQIVNSGSNSTVTATALDSYSNPVPGATLSGYVLPSAMGSVSGLGTTGSNGQTSGYWIAGCQIGAGALYVTGDTITGQAPITLTAGAPYTIRLQATPSSLYVGQTSNLLAYVTDFCDNPVTSGTVVSFTSSLGSLSLLTDTTKFNSGSASSSIASIVAGTAYITATSGSATGNATVNFLPGAPASLDLQASPTSLAVGNISVLTATVRDTNGNPVGSGYYVNFGTNLGNTLPAQSTTNGNGIATSTITSTRSGTATITATSGSATGNATATFLPGAPARLDLQASPTSLAVGNISALTAIVSDTYGNPVGSGIPVTFTTDLGNMMPAQSTTNGNGIATSTITSTRSGTATIIAASGLATDNVTVTFTAGVPVTVSLQASPTSLVVGNSSTLTATVRDTYGNLVGSGIPVTFTTDLGNTVSPQNTTNGFATSFISSTVVGMAHITATTTGATWGLAAVTFTPGTPMTITVEANPRNLTPNTGETAMITATAVDRFNNPVGPGYQLTGVLVPPELGSLSSLSPTNAYGQALGTWTAGNIVVSGRLSVTYGTRTGTTDIALLLSKPETISVQVVSPTLFANSGMTTLITATVLDRGKNPLPGAAVSFSLVPSTTFGSVIASGTTDSNGRATSAWAATAGSQVASGWVIASAVTATGQAAITLTADVPYSLTLKADPASPVAGIGSILTATVTDRFLNPVTDGTWVTFTRTQGVISWPMTTTHDGAAVSQINWTRVGPVLITATSSPATGTLTVNFGPNAPSEVTLEANPTTQVVTSSSVLTATIKDAYGNPVREGTLVTFTCSICYTSPLTRATVSGIVTSSVGSTRAGVAYITATSEPAHGTITMTFRAGAPTTTTVDINPRTLLVNTDTSAAITATLVDTYSNPVPGVTVTPTAYLSPTTLGQLSWQSPTTDLNGQAFGRWWAGTVPGSGILVVNGRSSTVTLLPKKIFLPVVMRNFPPIPTGTLISINAGADNTFQITVTLQVSATVPADYIESMRFSNDRVNWGDWVTFAPTATWKLDPRNGLKTVYVQFAGHWGGVSGVLSDNIFLFMNGDFSQPNLASWNQDPGNALGVSSPSSAALLGSPAYACNNVPVGYGSLFQSVIMPNVTAGQQLVLRFNEHIYTSDRNIGLQSNLDRFEVLWNGKRVYADMNQDKDKPPHPSYPPAPPAVCTVYDLGSLDVVVPVTGNPGDTISVVFRVYNQPDPYYNTYAYLDNVRLELEGRSDALSNEEPSLPETPDGYTGR